MCIFVDTKKVNKVSTVIFNLCNYTCNIYIHIYIYLSPMKLRTEYIT